MKFRDILKMGRNDGEVIATFGRAQLIKTLDCKFQLIGGSHSDRLSAREWVSLFMHEAVVRERP